MRLARIIPAAALLTLLTTTIALAPAAALAAPAPSLPTLVAVRAAHHSGFDRVTFQFAGGRPSVRVGYVSQFVHDPSGLPAKVAGSAHLLVVFHGANAHNASGAPTAPTDLKPALPSLKEVAQLGDFEGVVSYGLGLDHRVSFHVLALSAPPRIAVDVATTTAGVPPAAARLRVSPTSVVAGHPVTVSGSLGSSCPVGDQVTIISKAFVHTHDFAGLPAIFATVRPDGTYATVTTIPASKAPGAYSITGRCGGGNLGVAVTLLVRSPSGATLPFTGSPVLPQLAVGGGLLGLGSALVLLTLGRGRRIWPARRARS